MVEIFKWLPALLQFSFAVVVHCRIGAAKEMQSGESEPLLKQKADKGKSKPDEEKQTEPEAEIVVESSWLYDTLESVVLFVQKGPVSVKMDKKKWQWWHAWHVSSNLHQIFARDRDTDLNVLDGVRALAYLW